MRVDDSTGKGTYSMDKFSSKVHGVHIKLGGKLLYSLRIKTDLRNSRERERERESNEICQSEVQLPAFARSRDSSLAQNNLSHLSTHHVLYPVSQPFSKNSQLMYMHT